MSSSSRIVRFLFSLFGYSGVQWSSGRWLRAIVWDALFVAYVLFIFHVPAWSVFVLVLGQAIDAALLEPKIERSEGVYAVAGLIAVSVLAILGTTAKAVWVEAFRIPSGSSIPTILIGDHILVDKTARHPHRGDTVVFQHPQDRGKDLVKRVVAVGGDTVEIRGDNELVVNGTPVARQHVDGPCEYDDLQEDLGAWETRQCDAWDETVDGHTYRVVYDSLGSPYLFHALTVPANSYFVLGDNRDNSADSRIFGAVPQDAIIGVVRKVWFSSGPHGVRWDRIDKAIR